MPPGWETDTHTYIRARPFHRYRTHNVPNHPRLLHSRSSCAHGMPPAYHGVSAGGPSVMGGSRSKPLSAAFAASDSGAIPLTLAGDLAATLSPDDLRRLYLGSMLCHHLPVSNHRLMVVPNSRPSLTVSCSFPRPLPPASKCLASLHGHTAGDVSQV